MKAITVEPLQRESARVEDVPEPDPRNGSVLVEAIAVGVCGTDVEIVEGKYRLGAAGTNASRARTRVAGPRRRPGTCRDVSRGRARARHRAAPDPVPCPNCAVGEWVVQFAEV